MRYLSFCVHLFKGFLWFVQLCSFGTHSLLVTTISYYDIVLPESIAEIWESGEIP